MSTIRKEADALNIVHFKLVSGDEVIALINKNRKEDSFMVIEEPLELIRVFSDSNSSYSLSFQEWLPTSESRLARLNKSTVVAYTPCNLDTKENYLNTVISLAQMDIDSDSTEDTEETIPEVIH